MYRSSTYKPVPLSCYRYHLYCSCTDRLADLLGSIKNNPTTLTSLQGLSVSICHKSESGTQVTIHTADKRLDRKSTRLNSSHVAISYAVFCLKKKNTITHEIFRHSTQQHSH